MWRAVRSLAPRPRTRTPVARAVPRQAGVGNPGVTVPSIPRRYPLGVYWAWFCKVDVRHSARVPSAQRLSVCERAGRQAGRGRGRTLIRLVVMTSKRGRAATLLTGLAGGTNGWLCSERTSAPNVTARHALLYTFSVRWARGAPRKSRSTLISNRTRLRSRVGAPEGPRVHDAGRFTHIPGERGPGEPLPIEISLNILSIACRRFFCQCASQPLFSHCAIFRK
jgi:hypothetical protein